MEQSDKGKQPRNYFRLEYPHEVRPVLCIAKEKFPVINLSERGVKFAYSLDHAHCSLNVEDPVAATITFHDCNSTAVAGKILRADSGALVLFLSEGIPLQRIMQEQRFLLTKYGNLKRPFEI